MEFCGALRFYYLSHGQEIAKVVRLSSSTTTADLMPVLVEKFSAYIDKEKQLPELFGILMALPKGKLAWGETEEREREREREERERERECV